MKKAGYSVVVGFIIVSAAVIAGILEPSGGQATASSSGEIIAGRNVNMVSGTKLPWGDPWLQRQNEPSIAVSSRNPMHLFGGANDYRTIDMPDMPQQQVPGIPIQIASARDAWIGTFKSFDGAQSWITALLPGYPQDTSLDGTSSPIHGYDTACDPFVRAGANGLFFLSGIAFNRNAAGGAVFVARYIDNNNLEKVLRDSFQRPTKDSIEYVDTRIIGTGNPGLFLDMPSLAVDIPRGASGTGLIEGQIIPNANVYIAYTVFPGSTGKNVRSKLYFSRSTNSGKTWAMPIKISESQQVIQRAVIAVSPNDPTGKTIYVAFRRFLLDLTPDAIVVVKSVDGGRTFTKPIVVATLPYPFDQLMNENRFRTNTYPALAVDGYGQVYIAWTERRNPATGMPDPHGQARIVVSTSSNGLTWSPPQPVELLDENGPVDGHQVMPAMTYAGGKLMLVWYDQRGTAAKAIVPDSVTDFIEDQPGLYRHTLDVRAAMGTPGAFPMFAPSMQVSRYLYYFLVDSSGEPMTDAQGYYQLVKAEDNPVNYTLFQMGTRPFHGDYLDLASSPQILPPPATNSSVWRYNTNGTLHPTSFHAAWTDNRDVRPPNGDWWGDWVNYNPPSSEQPDPDLAQSYPCYGANDTGKRNQNVYTASLTGGVMVGSPGNTKQLDKPSGEPGGRRTFVVVVKNLTETYPREFELSFDTNLSGRANASFKQVGDQTIRKAKVGAFSSAAVTVYVDMATNPLAPVKVNVREGGFLVGYALLNPDSTNLVVADPDQTYDPLGDETHNPHVSNPKVWKYGLGSASEPHPGAGNPQVSNPRVHNSGQINPRVQNSSQENPRVQNKSATNQNVVNSETGNPRVQNPRVQNTALTDMTWEVTNEGNTTSSFQFDVVADSSGALDPYFENGTLYGQLLVYKVHTTPVDSNCGLKEEHHDELLVNVTNPRVHNPRVQNSTMRAAALAATSDGDPAPDITDAEATFWLGPDETAQVIFRVYDPDTTDGIDFEPQTVAAEVAAQAVNTNETDPVIVTQPDVPWEETAQVPVIGAYPSALNVKALTSSNPEDRILTIWNDGSGILSYAISDDADWLTVSPATGASTSQSDEHDHAVAFASIGMAAGTYTATITVTDPYAGNNPVRIPVTMVVSASLPVPSSLTLSGPSRAGAGIFSEAYTLTAVDSGGYPVELQQTATFSLTSDSDGIHAFYAAPNEKARITQVRILAGSSSVLFYYKDTVPAPERRLVAAWTAGGPDLGSAEAWAFIWPVVQQIVFERGPIGSRQIYAMNADATALTALSPGAHPCLSPGGGKIAFTRENAGGSRDICVMNADGSHVTVLAAVNSDTGGVPVWSPDETKIAFMRDQDIWVMNADGTGQVNLTNTPPDDYEAYPSWSPDGSKIAFHKAPSSDHPQVFIMNADGSGASQLTFDPIEGWYPAWSPDGSRIAFTDARAGMNVCTIRPDGTGFVQLTTGTGEMNRLPSWSPDGSRIVFMSIRDGNSELYKMNADGTGQTRLTNDPASDGRPVWGGSRIAFDSGGAIWHVNRDGTGLTRATDDGAFPSWSPDGTKIAFDRLTEDGLDIIVMTADSSIQTNITNNPAEDHGARWSPNGQKIVFTSTRDGSLEIYTMNADGSEAARLTNNTVDDAAPDWSPDGAKIAYSRAGATAGQATIMVMNADGTNPTALTANTALNTEPCWSPDGTRIAFASTWNATNLEIYVMNADGSGTWQRVTNSAGDDRHPGWSPDGKEIAFQSNRSGVFEVYVQRIDGVSPIWRTDMGVSTGRPSWRHRADLTHYSYEFDWKFGAAGGGDGEFSMPSEVAIDSSGDIYVSDKYNNRIQKFDSAGNFLRKWGNGGSGSGQFSLPMGIDFDGSGFVYVADWFNHRVQKFTSSGDFIMLWGGGGTGDGQFNKCMGIAVDKDGFVYVTDEWNHRVQKFTTAGVFVATWGSEGSGDGQFSHPMGIVVDNLGYVYVADQMNGRIQKFTSNGAFVAKWGSLGTGNGQFIDAASLAVDHSGCVYVADQNNHRIQKFTSGGVFLTAWGSQGDADGQLLRPVGIFVAEDGKVYVSDTENNRIQVFRKKGG